MQREAPTTPRKRCHGNRWPVPSPRLDGDWWMAAPSSDTVDLRTRLICQWCRLYASLEQRIQMENAVLNWPLYGGVHGKKKYTMMSYWIKVLNGNQAPKVHKTTLYLKYMNYIVAVNVNGSSLHEKLRVIGPALPKCACMSACDDMLIY